MFMLKRDKNLRSLERFLLKGERNKVGIAKDIASIVGVVIGVKSAMLGTFNESDNVNQHELWLFTQKLNRMDLHVIFYRRRCEMKSYMVYFVARSNKKARELHDAFLELWNKETQESNRRIGELLGYPETAINYYLRMKDEHSDGHFSERHMKSMERNRFYAHSATHEDEEFQAYEVPIYKALQKHCPKTTKLLKTEPNKRWLD
jgi:hypothetical protein